MPLPVYGHSRDGHYPALKRFGGPVSIPSDSLRPGKKRPALTFAKRNKLRTHNRIVLEGVLRRVRVCLRLGASKYLSSHNLNSEAKVRVS